MDKRVRLTTAQLSFTLIKVPRKSHNLKALRRWASGEAAGVDTLEAVDADLHAGDSGRHEFGNTLSMISAYAPTMTNPDNVKDMFYEDLNTLIESVRKSNKLLVLGDFNARVGKDYSTWERVLGHHGIGKCNSNYLFLLATCASQELTITNTLLRLPTRNKPPGCTLTRSMGTSLILS